jgi:hypothetical protein
MPPCPLKIFLVMISKAIAGVVASVHRWLQRLLVQGWLLSALCRVFKRLPRHSTANKVTISMAKAIRASVMIPGIEVSAEIGRNNKVAMVLALVSRTLTSTKTISTKVNSVAYIKDSNEDHTKASNAPLSSNNNATGTAESSIQISNNSKHVTHTVSKAGFLEAEAVVDTMIWTTMIAANTLVAVEAVVVAMAVITINQDMAAAEDMVVVAMTTTNNKGMATAKIASSRTTVVAEVEVLIVILIANVPPMANTIMEMTMMISKINTPVAQEARLPLSEANPSSNLHLPSTTNLVATSLASLAPSNPTRNQSGSARGLSKRNNSNSLTNFVPTSNPLVWMSFLL